MTPRGPQQPAARAGVPPFHVMRVVEAAAVRRAAGLPVHDLSVGQPSTPAPAPVLAAAHAALDADRLAYTGAVGIPELRDGIAGHYAARYALDVARGSVACTTGSSGGFLCAFLAAFDPGDVVVVPRPGYPAYRNMLTALGCRVVEVALDADFRLPVAALDALDDRPAGLVLASPANPTGSMEDAAGLRGAVEWCDRNGVRLISDEIYHGITFAEPAASAWRFSRTPIVVNSFSKYFSMTGWRLGWLLVPDDLVDAVDRLAGNFALCPPVLAQRAAVAAFGAYDELDGHVVRYRTNRDLLLRRLPQLGITRIAPPDGAFYIYADVGRWTDDSLSWAARLLAETGVATAPGVDFDPVGGGRYLRMCFAGATDDLAVAVEVFGAWLADQPAGSG